MPYEKTHICKHCGKQFLAHAGTQKYCSLECRKVDERDRQKIYARNDRAKKKDRAAHASFISKKLPSEMSIDEIVAAAEAESKKEGRLISYGEYVAKYGL